VLDIIRCGFLAYSLLILISMKTILKIECGYCGKDMGEKDGKGISGVSHSICPECFQKEMDSINNEFHIENQQQR